MCHRSHGHGTTGLPKLVSTYLFYPIPPSSSLFDVDRLLASSPTTAMASQRPVAHYSSWRTILVLSAPSNDTLTAGGHLSPPIPTWEYGDPKDATMKSILAKYGLETSASPPNEVIRRLKTTCQTGKCKDSKRGNS